MNKQMNIDKDVNDFCHLMVRLKDTEFLGLMKLMGISIDTDEIDEKTNRKIGKPAEDIINEAIDCFARLPRHLRKKYIKLLKNTLN